MWVSASLYSGRPLAMSVVLPLFLAPRSSTFLPPSAMGLCRVSSFIGGVPSLFHRKLLIFLTSVLSTSLGIPWTFVRYCVIPAMVIWIINFLPSIVGWLFDH